jgi:PAS domain S-box-containing protein
MIDIRGGELHRSVMEDNQERARVENDLNRVVDALPELVWTALPDGRLDFLNQR